LIIETAPLGANMSGLSEFLITVLTSATVSSGLAGLLLFITKSWISERLKNSIKSEYDQKLETHKAALRASTDKEIEQLKVQLQIAAKEHEVRYTRLHEQRAEIIAKTYSSLKDVHESLRNYVSIFEHTGGPSRQERRKIATDAHNAFHVYSSRRLIFFPKETALRLEKLDGDFVTSFNKFAILVDEPSETSNADLKVWMEVFEQVSGDIAGALSDLEGHFRELLGDRS
jgi:hypothetical protein